MRHSPILNAIRTAVCAGYALVLGTFLMTLAPAAECAIQFEDATGSAGFTYIGESWGSAWGDYDGDGLLDLWVGNHLTPPELFHNKGDGTFENVTAALLPAEVLQDHDMHGSAWADFDNDGDPDLLQSVGADIATSGGAGPKLLLVNDGGVFRERAKSYGLDFPEGRGRMLLWLDADNDGWLDLYNTARASGHTTATAALFRQAALGFENVTTEAGVSPPSNVGTNYAMLGDIDGVGGLELLTDDDLKFPVKALQTGPFPLNDIIQSLSPAPELDVITEDAVIADLDGDLDNDLYTVTGPRNSDIVLAQPNVLEGHLGYLKNTERGVRFTTTGDVLFDFRWLNKNQWSLANVHIGATGYSPNRFIPTLSSQDAVNHGIFPHTPGVSKGVYVGYDTAAGEWVFLVSTPQEMADFVINAETDITGFTTVGLDTTAAVLPSADDYYLNDGAGFTSVFGPTNPPRSEGRSIVAGDFDNDMDLDLYIVSTGPVQNLPNPLYENLGNGTFVQVANSGGAGGSINGRGDAVAMADYDRDGYLDLFVTNGKSRRPFDEDGPVQLFHNKGGGNHWLQLDLQGVKSNRDGVGARIELTAGGVTQLREQNAGIHARAQNQMRVHFGLGPNTQADQVVILWPSGVVQQLDNVVADQIMTVVEPAVAVNEPPVITPLANQSLVEDSASSPLSFRVGDLGTAPENLSVTASSSDPSVIPSSGLLATGNGNDRSLVITPVADRSGGPLTVTLTVSDGAATASTAFDVVVQEVNDAPLANNDNITLAGPGSATADIAANDSDVDNALDLASIQIVTAPLHGGLAINSDGSVTYTTSENGPLSDGFTYSIDDISGATSNTASVSIQIESDSGSSGTVPPDVLLALGLDPNAPDGDTDNDGVPDIEEIGADAGNPLDSDSDGIIDALEPGADATDAGVAAGLPVSADTSVTVITGAGESLSGVRVETAQDAPAGVDLTFGLISYNTTSAVGGGVTVRMVFSRDLPATLVVYKRDSNDRYSELPAAAWTRVDAREVEVYLTDGDPLLDQDGTANGLIVDPIAFGSPSTSAGSSTGGGGGCQMGHGGTVRDPLLPLLALSLLGWGLRRKAQRP